MRMGTNAVPARRLEEELTLVAELGLSGFFLLHHEVLELAREIAHELRGPDSARNALPPGTGTRLLCGLDRLLPDRSFPCRSRDGGSLSRPFLEQGARGCTGHRPRFSARYPGAIDPRSDRALRARARSARGHLLDLPLAWSNPRPRQSTRPAVCRARASRQGHRGQSGSGRGGAATAPGCPNEAQLTPLACTR